MNDRVIGNRSLYYSVDYEENGRLVMITVQECIKFAEECEEMAKKPSLAEDRDHLLKIARMWRDLAWAQAAVEAPVN